MEPTLEKKLKSYQDIAETFTELGRMDIVQKILRPGACAASVVQRLNFF